MEAVQVVVRVRREEQAQPACPAALATCLLPAGSCLGVACAPHVIKSEDGLSLATHRTMLRSWHHAVSGILRRLPSQHTSLLPAAPTQRARRWWRQRAWWHSVAAQPGTGAAAPHSLCPALFRSLIPPPEVGASSLLPGYVALLRHAPWLV